MMKSVYSYAAESGVPMGLYLTLMSACLLLSVRIPVIQTFLLPLLIGLPFLTFVLMRRMAVRNPSYRKISALWLSGIYTYIFGSLICTLLSSLYIIGVEPHFVVVYVENAISDMESSPLAAEYASQADMMRRAVDNHMLPTGLQFIASIAWGTCFLGSVLSLVIACIMGRPRKNTVKAGF